jgi:hypothetical protein
MSMICALGVLYISAQTPAPPAPTLYSIMINGAPISGNAPLNFVSGPGILFSAPQAVNGTTQITISPDTAVLLSKTSDQAGGDHLLSAVSNCPSVCSPGLKYVAAAMPVAQPYAAGQAWLFYPDVPTQPGATLSIGGLGPVPIQGTCAGACWLITVANPLGFIAH